MSRPTPLHAADQLGADDAQHLNFSEGALDMADTRAFLAGASRASVYRFLRARRITSTKLGAKRVFCKRSLRLLLQELDREGRDEVKT